MSLIGRIVTKILGTEDRPVARDDRNAGSATLRWLIAWFGLFQSGHVLLNGRYVLQRGDPPFPAPRGDGAPTRRRSSTRSRRSTC